MNCDVCLEPFDHSIHKPCHLACPHTFCLSCLNQLTTKKCPTCNKTFVDKNPNIALLKWIPESSYDLLKAETLKELIEINEAKKNIKSSREEKLNLREIELKSIKQIIKDETSKMINKLRQNEKKLTKECERMLDKLNADLDSNKYENNVLFQFKSKEKIENNDLNEIELNNLKTKIPELKKHLNHFLDKIKNYENQYEFIQNKISNDNLSIGEIKKVT
jgi:hypothetical protein